MDLEGTYDVNFGAETIGRVRVQRQGLYYQFACTCEHLDGMFQLVCDGVDLGLLVPCGGQLILQTKQPVKRFGQGSGQFLLRPRHSKLPQSFVPLRPEEPFAYLSRLENAYLATQNGQPGVVLVGDLGCEKL